MMKMRGRVRREKGWRVKRLRGEWEERGYRGERAKKTTERSERREDETLVIFIVQSYLLNRLRTFYFNLFLWFLLRACKTYAHIYILEHVCTLSHINLHIGGRARTCVHMRERAYIYVSAHTYIQKQSLWELGIND